MAPRPIPTSVILAASKFCLAQSLDVNLSKVILAETAHVRLFANGRIAAAYLYPSSDDKTYACFTRRRSLERSCFTWKRQYR